MHPQSIISYIKKQAWFFGIRAEASLLLYSAKQDGSRLFVKKWHGLPFADTLLMPLKGDYPVRLFNCDQAKSFHEASAKKVRKSPGIISRYIEDNYATWEKITKSSHELLSGGGTEKEKFFRLFDLYKKAGAQFNIIFSLGLKLTELKREVKNSRTLLKKHDVWRNAITPKEERVGEAAHFFIAQTIKRKKARLNPREMMRYLTLSELSAWIDGKNSDKKVGAIIGSRKKFGFIYFRLHGYAGEIISDRQYVSQLRRYLLQMKKQKENGGQMKGFVACSFKRSIHGRVIIIKDKNVLAEKAKFLDGKIIVAIQTTPHFIPYLRKVKAIITDEGGLTCHAAIVSREMNKPCVVGVGNATSSLADGDMIVIMPGGGIRSVSS